MSESKKLRTFTEIQQEYQQLVMKAGHIQYQVYTLRKDLDLLNNQLRDLNFEAAKVKEADDAAKKSAEESKTE